MSPNAERDVWVIALNWAAAKSYITYFQYYSPIRGHFRERRVEPYGVIELQCSEWSRPRQYLLAWDMDAEDWRTFRIDRLNHPFSNMRMKFIPRKIPGGDAGEFVRTTIDKLLSPYRTTNSEVKPTQVLTEQEPQFGPELPPVPDQYGFTCPVCVPGITYLMKTRAAAERVGSEHMAMLHPPEIIGQARDHCEPSSLHSLLDGDWGRLVSERLADRMRPKNFTCDILEDDLFGREIRDPASGPRFKYRR